MHSHFIKHFLIKLYFTLKMQNIVLLLKSANFLRHQRNTFQAPFIKALPLQNPEANKTASTARNISKSHHQLAKTPNLTHLSVFNESDRSTEVVFPDEDVQLIPRLDATPKCAKDTTYCEKLASYPHRFVKDFLRNAQGYDLFFGADDAEEDLVERHGNSERFVCASVSRVIYPQGAKNTKNEWKFIVNQVDEGYVQGIRVEECAR